PDGRHQTEDEQLHAPLSSTLPDHNARRGRFQRWLAISSLAIALGMALAGCAAQPLRVVAAGDLQLDGAGRADPLAQLAILDGDVRFVNLEGPLTTRGAPSGLDGRVDVASLANNHALDQGAAGRDDTARALAAAGVQPAWRDHDAELRRRGRRVIVL